MTPQNPRFAHDVEALVLSMPAARTLGLRFDRIALGEVDLTLPYPHTEQHWHGGHPRKQPQRV